MRDKADLRRVLVVIVPFMLQGCAAAGLTVVGAGAGVGMGTEVEQTMNGIVYKTYRQPVPEVRLASLKALSRMEMKVTQDSESKEGWQILAEATGRKIDIQLEKLTPVATRMRITVDEGGFFQKDAATASEIVVATTQAMAPEQSTKTAKNEP